MHISAALLVLASASLVAAHGRLEVPTPLSSNFQQIGSNCGSGAIKGTPTSLTAGQSETASWFILNQDGAGPLQVTFDQTGKGTNFGTPATITTQVPGNNRIAVAGTTGKAHPLTFTVPNLSCPASGCVMMVRQAGNSGFGSCALVNVGGSTGAATTAAKTVAAAPAAAAPATAAKTTAKTAAAKTAKTGKKAKKTKKAKGAKKAAAAQKTATQKTAAAAAKIKANLKATAAKKPSTCQ
ncbi:hypothetical protein HKX48_003198 [Thoreauomyces humboldtii]|nr:hypothetical protein HKX48_003198 [Thoreauomyces humboldtii]